MGLFLGSQFYSIDLCVYPYASSTQSVYCRFVVSFEWGSVSPPALFFFKIVLATLGPVHFMNAPLSGPVPVVFSVATNLA